MRVIARATLRWTLLVFFITFAFVALAGGIRLLPWAVSGQVGWTPLLVFARGILVVALESVFLLSLPVGWALAASALHDRREVRTCLLLGASPWTLLRETLPLAALFGALALLPEMVWGHDATAMGAVASELVAAARAGCDPVDRPVSVVPLLGLTWLCPADHAPVMVMTRGSGLVVRADAVTLTGDLRGAQAQGIRIDIRGPPRVHLEVPTSHLTGIGPFARAASVPPWLRSLVIVLGAWAGAFSAMAALFFQPTASRRVALALGGMSAGLGLTLLALFEKRGVSGLCYPVLPAAMVMPGILFSRLRFWIDEKLRPYLVLRGRREGGSPPSLWVGLVVVKFYFWCSGRCCCSAARAFLNCFVAWAKASETLKRGCAKTTTTKKQHRRSKSKSRRSPR